MSTENRDRWLNLDDPATWEMIKAIREAEDARNAEPDHSWTPPRRGPIADW